MAERAARRGILLLFADGVGLGADDPLLNPMAAADLPVIRSLLDGNAPVLVNAPYHGDRASLVAIDAVLGFDGTPQSGTGQAALLTGRNAVALHGGHFGPWVPAKLRDLVRSESVLAQVLASGRQAAFANAYPEEVTLMRNAPSAEDATPHSPEPQPTDRLPSDAPAPGRGRRRERRAPSFLRAGPPLAALGAGLLTRHTPALERGDAVASEITNDGWRERLGRTSVPCIDAARAGRNLARVAMRHDMTLFAHYSTDYAGHRQDMDAARIALQTLDAFLGGVLDEAGDDLLTLMVSDHGNIEDIRTGHTRNPAIGLVIGDGHAPLARRLGALTDITPAIMDVLAR